MSIDPNSSTPIFHQIAEYVRRSVAAGVYRAGEPIPSLRQMALDLTVNPNTVQRAYEELEREGLIEARKGLGMFVTHDGVSAARRRSEATVYGAFVTGIRVGRAAGMSSGQIREGFDRAEHDTAAEAVQPDASDDTVKTTGDQP